LTTKECDLLVVGAGPAGLSAAINGSSEGLNVCVLDAAEKLGGQARESQAIENYPMPFGPHIGVTGETLVNGFTEQANKFGCGLYCPVRAAKLIADGDTRLVLSEDKDEYAARSVLLSSGLNYRRLSAKNIGALMGRGIYYGMPLLPPKCLNTKTVGVVGGANSAGQAVVAIARNPRVKVKLLVRKKIRDRMSQYLIDRIETLPNVEVLENCTVTEASGYQRLETVTLNGTVQIALDYLFIFIGAAPRTYWLEGTVDLTPKGFILTGSKDLPYETNIQGVFAAGDVRDGSTKRIAAAAGEGSAAIAAIHNRLN
jgi:thioredoxin reductase (NADPH)